MQRYFLIIFLVFSTLIITTKETYAQDTAPTYQSLISMGDKEFNEAEYIKAKSYYQEALRLKKDDPTAKNKLNKTLQKIREQSEKEEIFYQHIDIADNHYNNGDYENALISYNKAIKLFPKDGYTLEQIKIVTQKINDDKETIAAFNEFVKNGDNFMSVQKYTEATIQYKSALELYPNNNNVKEKYQEAKNKKDNYDRQSSYFEQLKREAQELTLRKKYTEAIEKYSEALTIFPEDSEIKAEINSLTIMRDVAERYNSKINEADSLYLEKSYEKAQNAYNEALKVIPEDPYSLDMLARIDETVNSDEYLSLKNYRILIEEAKTLENNNNYNDALVKYKNALKLNPGDEFSTQKIEYLTNIIDSKNREIEINAQYTNFINKGDLSINKEDYYTALDYYTKAYELLPNKTEAKEKKTETEKRIKEIEAQLALEKQKWNMQTHRRV